MYIFIIIKISIPYILIIFRDNDKVLMVMHDNMMFNDLRNITLQIKNIHDLLIIKIDVHFKIIKNYDLDYIGDKISHAYFSTVVL
jgi:hypothetical protein